MIIEGAIVGALIVAQAAKDGRLAELAKAESGRCYRVYCNSEMCFAMLVECEAAVWAKTGEEV